MTKRRAGLKRAVVGVVAVATFALAASVAWATGTLDQRQQGPPDSQSDFCQGKMAQTFTAQLTGSLDTVELQVSRNNAGGQLGDLVVSILGTDTLANPGFPNDENVLATQTIAESDVGDDPQTNVETVVFDDPAAIQAGTTYAIAIASPDCVPPQSYPWGVKANNPYSGGVRCFFNQAWDCPAFGADSDFIFATYVTTPPPPPSADVTVSIAGPASAKKGAQVTYVITVSNAGPSTAHNVVLSDPVPAGATFLGITTTAGSCTGPRVGRQGPIGCALGDLVSGGSALISATLKVTAKMGSTIANVATAHSTQDGAGSATPDPQGSNNTASLNTNVTK